MKRPHIPFNKRLDRPPPQSLPDPVKWKAKYGGLEVSDARKLRALEAENARLKKLLAESLLENEVTKEALRKKW